MKKDKKITNLIKGIVVGYILGLIIVPYVKVEILTFLHSKEFYGLERQVSLVGESEYYKVFSYDSKHLARVYYVGKNHSYGNMFTFINEGGNWNLYQWDTIWSSSGSADDFIWPFYP